MSSYTSFAIIGAGVVGKHIVEAFAASQAKTIVLTRPTSAPKELPAGVKIVPVDYTDKAAVTAVLKENAVDVVISVISNDFDIQIPLADAAKEAGVKVFVPSEFGIVTVGLPWPKAEVSKHLESIGLPSLRVFTGAFVEYAAFAIGLGPEGKATILGKGDTPLSFTALPDIAGWLAYTLTHLPPSQFENKIVRLQGDRYTLNEVARLFKATVEQLDVAKIPKDKPVELFRALLLEKIEEGLGSTGWDAASGKDRPELVGSSNDLWPGHHWVTIKELNKL